MKNHDTPNKSPDPTRRTFIRRGLGAVAVSSLGFPMVLPSRVFGANERVVLGMIGVGNMGSTHVRGFSGSCGIAGIADAYLPRAEAAAKGLRGPNQTGFYQDYRPA